ncbi:hypothetical protein A9179_05290 [Pseudomonas alcaligenes]|uniref:DUF4340 domain-containing protein n=1 Tax=Aquipseudomonas alcaligenes TaxID=43263 RepID=A0ABR7RXY1_AQUAC|nr:DUF4340 domain-containing protein [Pseudomonas alcaligenes]MBC9249684.1 hypothetical protein [Pseudomonas alcaligenes]
MNSRGWLGLGGLLLLLLAGMLVVERQPPAPLPPAAPVAWLAALQDARQPLLAIEVRRPGQPLVRLERRATGWVLPAKAEYPADQQRVAELLRALTAAHQLAPRSARSEDYGQLGLAVQGAVAEQGIQLRLEREGGAPLLLLIGKTEQGGQLVRRADEAQSWLIDQLIELPANELQWLDRRVTAIPFAAVRELTLQHADGERLSLFRATPEQTHLQLRELPAGRRLLAEGAGDDSARLFADLQFNEVAPLAQIAFKGHAALRFRLEDFTGKTLQGALYLQAQQPWLVLESGSGLAAEQLPGPPGWAYLLDEQSYRQLAKKLTDMLAQKT